MASDKIAYLLLWPHVDSFGFRHVRPVLRAVPGAAQVARILGNALAASGEGQAATSPVRRARTDSSRAAAVA
jgi:hypothetical protein